MKIPRNLRDALRKGFEVTLEDFLSGCPETCRKVNGKMRMELQALSPEGLGSYEIVVPYIVTYDFGKPRAARKSDRF